jgi:hypothetical protein
MSDGMHRLRKMGATKMFVGSYSVEAGKLYASMGFTAYELNEPWVKWFWFGLRYTYRLSQWIQDLGQTSSLLKFQVPSIVRLQAHLRKVPSDERKYGVACADQGDPETEELGKLCRR